MGQGFSRRNANLTGGTMPQRRPLFDFTADAGRAGWDSLHDISRVSGSADGLTLYVSGDDPYLFGPPVLVPTDKPLWLVVKLRSSDGGTGQVFYFADGSGPTEESSVRFPVRQNRWETVRVPLTPLPNAPAYRFRIDPPGTGGAVVTVVLLDVEARTVLAEPNWPRPPLPQTPPSSVVIRSSDLEIVHESGWGDLRVFVAGEPFAVGNPRPLLGYQTTPDAPLRWLDVAQAGAKTSVRQERDSVRVETRFADTDGGAWTWTQTFRAGKNGVQVDSAATVSADRYVAYLPWITLLPGAGSFGTEKTQALFAGLEYLDKNEPSSSEADVRGPGALRHVPDADKITLPLLALAARDRWLSLSWEPSPLVAALFDSPDRRFASGGHLLSLLFPGTEAMNARPPGSVLPHAGRLLRAGERATMQAVLSGGHGDSVVPALQAYVARRGLLPAPQTDTNKTARTLAAGWLDSRVNNGDGRFRHAYPGDFEPQPAADAAVCLNWLASRIPSQSGDLANRLQSAAQRSLQAVPSDDLPTAAVGHVRNFSARLWYGGPAGVIEDLARAEKNARAELSRFDANGTASYQSTPGKTDLGATHFAHHSNGMTAQLIAHVLDTARLTASHDLTQNALRRLRQINNLYRNTVPRGAQTWEVPLHTPDILASAHLVRAFVRGYELSGDRAFLESARYWAWTGVPFAYLVPPTPEPVGLYSTIAVYGATQWQAPLWIGLPVQWCGLVYADALYDLAVWDKAGPWCKLANGIVASGVTQTWPAGSNRERQGLLPDSFNLPGQVRNDVAINPATLQFPYARMINCPLYDCYVAAPGGPFIHAPGRILPEGRFDGKTLRVTINPAPVSQSDYIILFSGFTSRGTLPTVRVNGNPNVFREGTGHFLTFPIRGQARVEIVGAEGGPLRMW